MHHEPLLSFRPLRDDRTVLFIGKREKKPRLLARWNAAGLDGPGGDKAFEDKRKEGGRRKLLRA